MTADYQLRGLVAAQLGAMSNPGGALDTYAEHSTKNLYGSSPTRKAFRDEAVAWYLGLAQQSPSLEGRTVVLTSGPPGAGKSTLLDDVYLSDYRRLDADIIKDYLIERAMADGIYDHLLTMELADGAPMAPRELAPLVHTESSDLLKAITADCIERHENVIVEATLRWEGHGPELVEHFDDAGYLTMRVLNLDVPQALAEEQALSRWWQGRIDWIDGTNSLGGRYMPPTAIADCFDGDGSSKCAKNALEMGSYAQSSTLEVKLEMYERNSKDDTVHLAGAGAVTAVIPTRKTDPAIALGAPGVPSETYSAFIRDTFEVPEDTQAAVEHTVHSDEIPVTMRSTEVAATQQKLATQKTAPTPSDNQSTRPGQFLRVLHQGTGQVGNWTEPGSQTPEQNRPERTSDKSYDLDT